MTGEGEEAAQKTVNDGQVVCFRGFTRGIPVIVCHEMIQILGM